MKWLTQRLQGILPSLDPQTSLSAKKKNAENYGNFLALFGEITNASSFGDVLFAPNRPHRVVYSCIPPHPYSAYCLEVHFPQTIPAVHKGNSHYSDNDADRNALYSVNSADNRVIFIVRGLSSAEIKLVQEQAPYAPLTGYKDIPPLVLENGHLVSRVEGSIQDKTIQPLPCVSKLQRDPKLQMFVIELDIRSTDNPGSRNTHVAVPVQISGYYLQDDGKSKVEHLDGLSKGCLTRNNWWELFEAIGGLRYNASNDLQGFHNGGIDPRPLAMKDLFQAVSTLDFYRLRENPTFSRSRSPTGAHNTP